MVLKPSAHLLLSRRSTLSLELLITDLLSFRLYDCALSAMSVFPWKARSNFRPQSLSMKTPPNMRVASRRQGLDKFLFKYRPPTSPNARWLSSLPELLPLRCLLATILVLPILLVFFSWILGFVNTEEEPRLRWRGQPSLPQLLTLHLFSSALFLLIFSPFQILHCFHLYSHLVLLVIGGLHQLSIIGSQKLIFLNVLESFASIWRALSSFTLVTLRLLVVGFLFLAVFVITFPIWTVGKIFVLWITNWPWIIKVRAEVISERTLIKKKKTLGTK